MKHQSSCKCYYCTKRRKEQQAQIAGLSAERSALLRQGAAASDSSWDAYLHILDCIQADLDLCQDLKAAALCATDPSVRPDDESVLAGRELMLDLLPDVPFSTFGGYASADQLAAVRAVVGDYPIREIAPDRVYVPELRAVLRRWASAQHRRAVVLAS